MCDSTLKLEVIEINVPVNLNFRSKFRVKLNLLSRLDGCCDRWPLCRAVSMAVQVE